MVVYANERTNVVSSQLGTTRQTLHIHIRHSHYTLRLPAAAHAAAAARSLLLLLLLDNQYDNDDNDDKIKRRGATRGERYKQNKEGPKTG